PPARRTRACSGPTSTPWPPGSSRPVTRSGGPIRPRFRDGAGSTPTTRTATGSSSFPHNTHPSPVPATWPNITGSGRGAGAATGTARRVEATVPGWLRSDTDLEDSMTDAPRDHGHDFHDDRPAENNEPRNPEAHNPEAPNPEPRNP